MNKRNRIIGFITFALAFLVISCSPPDIEPTPTPGGEASFSLTVMSQGDQVISQTQLVENTDTVLKVKVVPENGFSGKVTLEADGLPEGVVATFEKTDVHDETVLTLSSAQGIQGQITTIKIRGSADSFTTEVALELTLSLPSDQTGYPPGVEKTQKSIMVNGKELYYEVIEGLAIYQGDMIIGTAEDIANLPNLPEILMPQGVSCDELLKYCEKWPDGEIPYSIADNWGTTKNNQTMRDRISYAIAEWENKTGLRFIPATSGDRLNFTNANSCTSELGFADDFIGTNVQNVKLSLGCSRGAVIHEIGHAIGLHHEQSRSDRDRYVKILDENIIEDKKHNFDIADDALFLSATDIGEYDYDSIMHYGPYDFSKNGLLTIETIPSGIPIGQRLGLSEGDIQAAYYLYRPKFSITGPSGSVLKIDKKLTYTLDFPFKPVADQYIQWRSSRQSSGIGKGKTLSLNAQDLPLGLNTITASVVIKGMTLAEKSIQLDVEEVLGNVTVVLHEITVHDDRDGAFKGAGDIWLEYLIAGVNGRWPDSGNIGIDTRETKKIRETVSLELRESDDLDIFVIGIESDSPDADDSMGQINEVFRGSDDWGEGWHHIKSSNGSFTLHFYVSLNGEAP